MHPNGPPPLFAPAGSTSGKSSSKSRSSSKKSKNLALPALNIDDVFGEIAFTPDGQLEMKDGLEIKSGEGRAVKTMASRVADDGEFRTVAAGGGLYTTQLHQGDKPSLAMGAAEGDTPTTTSVPFRKAPQADHQLEYAAVKKDKKKSSKDKSEYVLSSTAVTVQIKTMVSDGGCEKVLAVARRTTMFVARVLRGCPCYTPSN